jgi:3-keto-disaccharide hydrolase
MSLRRLCRTGIGLTLLLFGMSSTLAGQDDPFTMQKPPPVVGRWDLTVRGPEGDYPSWLEVRQSGYRTLVGSFVGRTGSARPITRVDFEKDRVEFAIPPQWEHRTDDQHFAGRLQGDVLRGETTDDKGRRVGWEGRRAPSLARTKPPRWGEPVELFNGRDMAGWKPRNAGVNNGWLVREGALVNAAPGNDLRTELKFTDFKLHAEFRYPQGSNSGIYLRGRYEVQIEDNHGEEPDSHKIGGVYGFLTPCTNAGKEPGEWQTLEATLVGRTVTVVLNGERVIDRQSIPGITGGALDSDEGEPGPILLQGDHGPVEFRKLTLTPGVE